MKFSLFNFLRKSQKNDQPKSQTTNAKKAPAPVAASASPLERVAQSPDAEVRKQAFAELSTQQDYVEVIATSKYPDMRFAAADALSEEDPLRSALAIAKQKDKNAARVLRAKVNDIDHARTAKEERQLNLNATLEEAVRLANGAWSPSYNASYQALLQRWQGIAESANEEQRITFETAQVKITDKLEANRPKVEAPQDELDVCNQLDQLCIAVQAANLVEAQIAVADWSSLLDQYAERWKAAITLVPAEDDLQQRYYSATQSLRSALDVVLVLNKECQGAEDFSEKGLTRMFAAMKAADWRMGATPAFFAELKELISEVKTNQAEEAKQIDADKADIHKMFAGLRRAIREGRLVPAKSLAIKLEHYLEQPHTFEVESYKEQLADLQQEVFKLLDWNQFATGPKFVSLLEQMRELAAEELPDSDVETIQTRLNAIKGLQAEWRELGRNDDAEQWKTFQDLGHEAYKPVDAYYEEQKKVRGDNLNARRNICEKLTQALENAIENGDYKSLEKQANYARRDWGNYRNVDRKDSVEVKERFDHLLEQIEKQLAPQYEANLAAKEALIQKMDALAAQELSQHLLHQCKELQAAWKLVGITPRKDDQVLWERFRESGNKIFDAVREQRQSEKEAQDALFDAAKACIEDVKSLSVDAGEDVLQAIRDRFTAIDLGEGRGAEKIQDVFDRALNDYDNKKDEALKSQGTKAFQNLQHCAFLCHQAEMAEQDKRANVFDDWDDYPVDNTQWLAAIEARKADALAGKVANSEATQARRMLCVQLEILLEQDSPSEDKALRMEYQLSRLQAGQRNNTSGDDQLQQLQQQWCLMPPAEADHAVALQKRYEQLVK